MAETLVAEVSTFPVSIAEAVRQAVKVTLGSICGADPQPLPNGHPHLPGAAVVGIISYTGTMMWSFALIIPEKTAPALAEKFAGFAIPFASPDMGDVVGELANVIAGDISARLETRGIVAQLSLPTMMRGHDLELLLPADFPSLRLGYATPQGPLSFRLVAARTGATVERWPGVI